MSNPSVGFHDADVRFSPDGRRIAFTRSATVSGMSKQLLVQNADGGGTRVLTDGKLDLEGIDWSMDGRRIIAASRGTLIEIDAVTGERSFIAAPGFDIVQPAVSRIDGTILFVQSLYDVNIWKMPIDGGAQGRAVPSVFIASTRVDNDPRFSPDGNRIAFISDRSGECSLYVSDINGGEALPIATFDTNCWNVRDPRWSPDGLNLAFDIDENARRDVYIVSTAGGPIRRITEEASDDFAPGWSADGRSVYVTSDRSGSYELWLIDISDDSKTPVSFGPGRGGAGSSDGLWIYYSLPDGDGLWRKPVAGGESELVARDLATGDYRNWRLVDDGLLYVRSGESRELVRLEFSTGETTVLWQVPEEVRGFLRADISPSGQIALFSHVDQDEDDLAMLVPIRE